MNKEDITQYSEDELSLRVFNDEYLYSIRHKLRLWAEINEMFKYTKEQRNILIDDIRQDNEE